MCVYPKPRQQAMAATMLFAMVFSSFAPLISEPAALPAWWGDPARGVTNNNPANNLGIANIGQLKHIANQAHAELEALLPGGAGYAVPFTVPPGADATWYANQKKVLNLGQLKAVAKPLYDRLNGISPTWVKNQLIASGLTDLNTHYFEDTNSYIYPWNPNTPVSENYKPATVGQLKAVFCLRLRENTDNDSMFDIWEYAMISAHPGAGINNIASLNDEGDVDGDSVSNLDEYNLGLNPFLSDSDGDGLNDYFQIDLAASWSFEELNGTIASDSSGQGKDATLVNGPVFKPNEGVVGGALEITAQTAHLVLPHDVLDGAGDVTYSIWYRTIEPSKPFHPFLSGANPGNNNECLFYIDENAGQIRSFDGDSAASWNGYTTDLTPYTTEQWHHFVWVRDQQNQEIRYYVDGVKTYETPRLLANLQIPVNGLMIGQEQDSVGGSFDVNQRLHGLIDEVRVYHRILSDEEIGDLAYVGDSDNDGLPDAWEYALINSNTNDTLTILADVNPTGTDLAGDFDGDGADNITEFQNGTDATDIYSGGTVAWPSDAIAAWYRTDQDHFITNEHGITQWSNSMADEYHATQGGTTALPEKVDDLFNGHPAAKFDDNDYMIINAGGQDMFTPDTGFAVMGVFRPTGPGYAVFSNDVYLQNGFRVGISGDKLKWYSHENGVLHTLSSQSDVVTNTAYQFTLHHEGLGGKSEIYLNGNLEVTQTGKPFVANTRSPYLNHVNGTAKLENEWGELILINRALSRAELKMVQDYLMAKCLGQGPLYVDSNNDDVFAYQVVATVGLSGLGSGATAEGGEGLGDSDKDGLSDAEELAMGSRPDLKDTDGDGKEDGEEAFWWDDRIQWPRSQESKYVVVELGGLNLTAQNYGNGGDLSFVQVPHDLDSGVTYSDWTIVDLSNAGHVLVREDLRVPADALSYLNGSSVSESIVNHVWKPSSQAWVTIKSNKVDVTQTALSVATSVSAAGKVAGYTWLPLSDGNGGNVAFPGVEKLVISWDEIISTHVPSTKTALFHTDGPASSFTSDNNNIEVPPLLEWVPETAVTEDGRLLTYYFDQQPAPLGLKGDLKLGNTIIETYEYDEWEIDMSAATMTRDGDVFFSDASTGDMKIRLGLPGPLVFEEFVVDGLVKPQSVHVAARISNNSGPVDILAISPELWARHNTAWMKVQQHPKPRPQEPLTKGIGVSGDGVVLLTGGDTILRNGKWVPLSDVVASTGWSDFKMTRMNDGGMMAGRATKNGQEEIILLLPVEVAELSPKLVDESENEIEGSEKPAIAPKSTEMVERDPLANPQIQDASTVRIAWRDMKVKIGKALAGKTVTWSMTPKFTPLQAGGTPEAVPRFRGNWGTAANAAHRNYFSASTYGQHGFALVEEAQYVYGEVATFTDVHQRATTTVDADGYTSIRVNIPPIGFNKAQIKIEIENVEGEIDLIELEVPAVIVIDPGHGGVLPPTDQERIAAGYIRNSRGQWVLGGSSVNNATAQPSLTLEKNMAWDISSKLRSELIELRTQDNMNVKVLLTRTGDNNLTLAARANKGRDNGADVLLSIHFNGYDGLVRGTETHIDHTGNLNRPLDKSTSQRINTSIFEALTTHDPNAVNRGPKDERGLDVLSDPDLGNTANYGPLSAVLAEIEFIDVEAVDRLLNTNANHEEVRTSIADEIAGALIEDIKTNP